MTDRQERRAADSPGSARRPRSVAALMAFAVTAALVFSGLLALGTWQVFRLQWKEALIGRVDQRVHAPPVPAPGPERWPQLSAESDEYRHVALEGVFLDGQSALVQASTELGAGFWLLTPLREADGDQVLVNRGFIPAEAAAGLRREIADARAGQQVDGKPVRITGLLRISEPHGGFLRRNDPAADRWFSRDVQAIAAARGLERVAPYFVDAGAGQRAAAALGNPTGGLTVVAFQNNHMVYALTWYALALMVAAASFWVVREERRARRIGEEGNAGKH